MCWLMNSWRGIRNSIASPADSAQPCFRGSRRGVAAEFVALLREQFETSVVPGEFFEQPQHFRIGFCGATETVRRWTGAAGLPPSKSSASGPAREKQALFRESFRAILVRLRPKRRLCPETDSQRRWSEVRLGEVSCA